MATIAYECEISSRSVQTHIRQLVKDGFVRVEERRDSSGVNRSNIYHLTFNNEGENHAPYQKKSQKHGANGAGREGAGDSPRISQLLGLVKEPKTPLIPPRGIWRKLNSILSRLNFLIGSPTRYGLSGWSIARHYVSR